MLLNLFTSQTFGIILVLLSCSGYYLSFKAHQKSNFKIAIFLLVILGLFLRLYCSFDFYLHSWDEKFHALVAKNLIGHPFKPTLYDNPVLPYDYTNWTSNHVWLHKQPFTLWSMAFSMWLFGCNEIALRFPSILLSSLSIVLTYSIGKYFFSRKIAFIAAFLFSINGLLIELSSGRIPTDHVDSFFIFFILMGIYLSVKFSEKKLLILNILAGMSMGIAILCKWLPALIIVPVWLFLVYDVRTFSRKEIVFNLIILMMTAVAVFLPWQLYSYMNYPLEYLWEQAYNTKHLYESVENHSGSFFYFFNKLRINYGELIYLPLIWFGREIYLNPKNYKNWAICLWITLPLVFFSFVSTKMPGYIAFIAPALFIVTAAFFDFLLKVEFKRNFFKLFRTLLAASLIILPIRYSIERIKPFSRTDRNPEKIIRLKNLGNEYQNAVLFNYSDPVTAMFYTNLTAYSHMPDSITVKELSEKGYLILITNPSEFDSKFKTGIPVILNFE